MRIFLVEDDFFHLHDIQITIEELGHECIGTSSDSLEILDKVEELNPDVILMDIHLNGKQEGIALAKRIRQQYGTLIIFTSSDISVETMSAAIETRPVTYITKPINKNDLQAALILAQNQLNSISESENELSINENEIYIKSNNRLVKVLLSDILYAFADTKNYCTLVVKNDKKLTLRMSIVSLKKILNSANFVQTHRAYIINWHKVDSLSEQNQEINIEGHSIPLGKTFKDEIYQKLNII
jgi:two-component system, LytTR family, response regulator LytT